MTRVLPLALLLALTLPGQSAAHEPEAVRGVGDALLEDGDSYRAIGAYKEYLLLAPDAGDADLVRYRIALAYLAGGQYQAAWESSAVVGRPEVTRAARLLGGAALHLQKSYRAVPPHLAADPGGYARYLSAWSRLRAWDFDGARVDLVAVPESSAYHASAAGMAAELGGTVKVPYRSPALAGLLSIVPGLGHAYLGMWGVAASALMWNGAFGWGLYETIRAKQWGLTALVAVLESVWYFGTIYGAIAGAHRFNRDATLNFVEDLASRYPPPGPPPQPTWDGMPPLSVSVGGRF